jgi:outer membrane protein assembly factor BamB
MAALIGVAMVLRALGQSRAADWPMWGRDPSRNMLSRDVGLPISFDAGKQRDDGTVDPATVSKNVKWVAKLGTQSYGNPTIADGRLFIGTNNAWPHFREDMTGDYGVLLCLNQQTGKRLWSLFNAKLAAGKVSDWDQVGLCCSPTVDGNCVYIVTNRCEVVCLDAGGDGKGNEKVLWRYDMRDELGVFPHNMTSSSVLVVGDRLFVTTSNAVDWTERHIPSPDAPALICLDKKSGRLLGQERSGICQRMFLSNWSSPAYGVVGGKAVVVFGGGDGFCYGFDPTPDSAGTLREIWRCDCNPPERRTKDGKPRKHSDPDGPSEIISTPVVAGDRVYVAIGHEPEGGEGAGAITCIDASRTGDITASGKIWVNDAVNRSVSTASVAGGLVYLADFPGIVHCLDAGTGKEIWQHDTEGHIWGSTLVADGIVYVGNESGTLFVFAAGKDKKLLGQVDTKDPIYSTPITSGHMLYVNTSGNLYAVEGEAK